MTLAKLHDVLQAAFGWHDGHLHQFVIGGTEYGVPDPDNDWGEPVRSERRVRLDAVLGRGVKRFRYDYDFGDGWEHDILVEKRLRGAPGAEYPLCLTGRRAGPMEDSGGPWGYAELVALLADPEHPDPGERREWAGEDFDPEAFDLDQINVTNAQRNR